MSIRHCRPVKDGQKISVFFYDIEYESLKILKELLQCLLELVPDVNERNPDLALSVVEIFHPQNNTSECI